MLHLLNLLGILSENKGNNNVTGGALQALNLPGFTFRNQPFWNYSLIHLASLPSPTNCTTLMPFSAKKREDSNFLRIQKANSHIHLQNCNKRMVGSCFMILLTYNFCPVLLFCSCHHWEEETFQKVQIPSQSKPLPFENSTCAEHPLLACSLHWSIQTVHPCPQAGLWGHYVTSTPYLLSCCSIPTPTASAVKTFDPDKPVKSNMAGIFVLR